MTTLSATILPTKEVNAYEEDVCPIYQNVVTYDTDNGIYTVKKGNDNSVEVVQENTANKITISNKGEVTLITDDGFKCNMEKFTINNFNAGNLDITTDCIKNKNVKECVKTISNYFNSNTFNNENYLETYKGGLEYTPGLDYKYIEEVSKNQYSDVYNYYLYNINNSGIKMSNAAALAPSLLVGELVSSDASALAVLSSLTTAEVILIIAAIAGITYMGYAICNDAATITTDDIYDDSMDVMEISKETANIMGLELVDAIFKELEAKKNDGIDNDYFKAYLVSNGQGGNDVQIDFKRPLSTYEAAEVLLRGTYEENIYTIDPRDAKEVIKVTGNTPGTSNNYYPGRAECHAYKASYKAYNPKTDLININKLRFNPRMEIGEQFWHFHFLGKDLRIDENKFIKNGKHVFFGKSVLITQYEKDKYGNKDYDIYVVDEVNEEIFKRINESSEYVKKLIYGK